MVRDHRIDGGTAFDWGRTSSDYAKYRDIYPEEFYHRIVENGLCVHGQRVLDIGTGTGVIPRNLYRYGAEFTGIDLSKEQIEQAVRLSRGMEIHYLSGAAEECGFPDETFDVITACQCFFYFKHEELAPKLYRFLKKAGRLVVLYMAWLPYEDLVAGESERMVLSYNPAWSGGGETRHPIEIPEIYQQYFELERQEIFDLQVPFTRESWNGRMKACRGIGASLSEEEVARFDREHCNLLEQIAPEHFSVLHYAAMCILRVKK